MRASQKSTVLCRTYSAKWIRPYGHSFMTALPIFYQNGTEFLSQIRWCKRNGPLLLRRSQNEDVGPASVSLLTDSLFSCIALLVKGCSHSDRQFPCSSLGKWPCTCLGSSLVYIVGARWPYFPLLFEYELRVLGNCNCKHSNCTTSFATTLHRCLFRTIVASKCLTSYNSFLFTFPGIRQV